MEPLVWKINAISSSCISDMSGSETGVLSSIRSEVRARYMGRGKSFNIDSKDAS